MECSPAAGKSTLSVFVNSNGQRKLALELPKRALDDFRARMLASPDINGGERKRWLAHSNPVQESTLSSALFECSRLKSGKVPQARQPRENLQKRRKRL